MHSISNDDDNNNNDNDLLLMRNDKSEYCLLPARWRVPDGWVAIGTVGLDDSGVLVGEWIEPVLTWMAHRMNARLATLTLN